jgi:hypothetical protein
MLATIIADFLRAVLVGLNPSNPKWAYHTAILLLAVLLLLVSVVLIVKSFLALA